MVTGCPRVPFTLKDECRLAIAARLQGGAKVETHVGGNAEAVEVGFSSTLHLCSSFHSATSVVAASLRFLAPSSCALAQLDCCCAAA